MSVAKRHLPELAFGGAFLVGAVLGKLLKNRDRPYFSHLRTAFKK
jgi:hypothetical protein